MSGLHEVDCSGCGRRHVTNGEQARTLRVLRCECGQFVRLDRALAERRSEPTPPPVTSSARGEEEEDATRMMSSHAAMAELSGAARAPQPSLAGDDRVSRPTQKEGTLRPAAARQRQPSIAPTDKPLWYVDLGGTELVEMTIEQLILARRSGKLGEGALVWREGMPSWRPVGTLIPAASASTHPAPHSSPSAAPTASRPSPPAAIRTPLPDPTPAVVAPAPAGPSRDDATPRSLGSYERPLATLEFALERPEPTPLLPAIRAPFPSLDSSASRPSRPPAPLARASLSSSLSTPFPRPAHLPRVASVATPSPAQRLSPPPPPPPPPSPSPIPVVAAPRASDRPNEQALSQLQAADLTSERPRWVSACIALVVCVTASAAGASLVRTLKQPRPTQAVAASAAASPAVSALAPSPVTPLPPAAPSSAPLVVNLESLSVEHKRAPPRAVRVVPKPTPSANDEGSDETSPAANDSTPEPAATETPNSSDLPAAARSNPYGSGSLIDQIKKATADEEAGQ